MVLITDMELAQYWIKYCALRIKGNLENEFFEMSEEVYTLAEQNPIRFCSVVVEILSHTKDKKILSILGVGPMENFINKFPSEALSFIKNYDLYRERLQTVLLSVDQEVISRSEWESLIR